MTSKVGDRNVTMITAGPALLSYRFGVANINSKKPRFCPIGGKDSIQPYVRQALLYPTSAVKGTYLCSIGSKVLPNPGRRRSRTNKSGFSMRFSALA